MGEAPRYVAKKKGDQYVMVRVDTPLGCEHMGYSTAGGMLLIAGLLRRGRLGSAAMLLGSGLLYRGLTGKNPLHELRRVLGVGQFDSGPTFQNDAVKPVEQKPVDEVDEASMESFPASDAPARMTPATTPS